MKHIVPALASVAAILLSLISCGKNDPDSEKTLADAWWTAKPSSRIGMLNINLDGNGHYTLDRVLDDVSMEYQLDERIKPYTTFTGTYTVKDGIIYFEDTYLFADVIITDDFQNGNFEGCSEGNFFKLVSAEWNDVEPKTYSECKKSVLFLTYYLTVVSGGTIKERASGEGFDSFSLYTGPRNPLE